jgi:hypothetical protein
VIHLLFIFNLFANICTTWQVPKQIGLLPHKQISESSGVQVSKSFSDRLYHINDSGDGPFFYITNFKGEDFKSIKVENFYPVDVEDITIATYSSKDYIVIADIGDNLRLRNTITLYFIEEKSEFPSEVKPDHVVQIKYPNGEKKNAEGFAFHPNGDLYIFTKEEDVKKGLAFPFSVFKISKEIFLKKQLQANAELVGMIDLPKLQPRQNWLGQVVTALDIDSNGKWLLLTYKNAIHSSIDLTKKIPPVSDWKLGKDYTEIAMLDYPQQEAISFIPGKEAFVFTTEYKKKYKQAPISQVFCAPMKK